MQYCLVCFGSEVAVAAAAAAAAAAVAAAVAAVAVATVTGTVAVASAAVAAATAVGLVETVAAEAEEALAEAFAAFLAQSKFNRRCWALDWSYYTAQSKAARDPTIVGNMFIKSKHQH